MEEVGKITELIGTKAKIEITPSSLCGKCAQEKVCNPFGQNKKLIELNNTVNGQIGDLVKIEIKRKARFLRYHSYLVYPPFYLLSVLLSVRKLVVINLLHYLLVLV